MYAEEAASISISRTLGEVGRVWTIYATEGPSVCGSCAAKLECFLCGRSARAHAGACVSQEDEDAEVGCNSNIFINVFGIIIDSIISLTCVFADFISGVLVAPHETAWEPGCRRMCPFAWLHVEQKLYTIVTIYG